MGLTCSLSPAVYAELYSLLATAKAKELSSRLDLIGKDETWLADMSRWYRLHWEWQLETFSTPQEVYEGMGAAHGQLATWLLSPLRGECDEFSRTLRSLTAQAHQRAEDKGVPRAGKEGQPAVVAWTLGCVPGDYDRELPVVFAEQPPDPDVAAAYDGLVQHIIDLGPLREPWPEMIASSVLWRCAGLAEGMAPQIKPNLESSLAALMARVRDVLQDSTWRGINEHWKAFRHSRNALTHLTGRDGSPAFSQVSDQYRRREDLLNTLVGATTFVAHSVRASLLDPDDDLGRAGIATAVESELSWRDDQVAA